MKKENLRILFAGLAVSLFPVFAYAQVQKGNEGEKPIFVNIGAMRVAEKATGADATMLITRSLALHDNSDIFLDHANSQLNIGGSVYQGASSSTSKGFSVNIDGTPSGLGTVAFVDVEFVSNQHGSLDDWHNEDGNQVGPDINSHFEDVYNSDVDGDDCIPARYITAFDSREDLSATHDSFMNGFKRSKNYIAFPNIKIVTDDRIMLPAKMGIDAKTITIEDNLKTNEKYAGVFYLESAPFSGKVYDASLRITGIKTDGESEKYVSPKAVMIERDVSIYRRSILENNDTPEESNEAPYFVWMPFASPFGELNGEGGRLRSGYFAGNFVRKTQPDPTSGHVEYVYANPPSAANSNIIDRSAYITDAIEPLDPKTAYVINLRPEGFPYSSLKTEGNGGGLWWTGADGTADEITGNININKHYDRNVFVFGNQLYTKGLEGKQLFAENTLFTASGKTPKTDGITNWVIGNSYTAGIDVNKLIQAMDDPNNNLTFKREIQVYYGHANQGYMPYKIPATIDNDPPFNIIENFDVIPTQVTFLLRVLNGSPGSNFKITSDMLKHGDTPNNEVVPDAAKGNNFSDEVLFTVAPVNNPKQRDVALMGFRSKAKGTYDSVDLEKAYNATGNSFQLYSISDDNQRLAGNAMSFGRENAPLSFKPSSKKEDFVISTSRLESLNTEIVFLEDLKAKTFTDLRVKGEYEFTAAPSDNANRFIVHFTKKSLDGKIPVKNDDLNIFYDNGDVVVKSLLEQDKGSLLIIANAQGKIVANGTVSASDVDSAEMRLPVSLVDGVYVASLKGNRNVSKKFVVKPRLQ